MVSKQGRSTLVLVLHACCISAMKMNEGSVEFEKSTENASIG